MLRALQRPVRPLPTFLGIVKGTHVFNFISLNSLDYLSSGEKNFLIPLDFNGSIYSVFSSTF